MPAWLLIWYSHIQPTRVININDRSMSEACEHFLDKFYLTQWFVTNEWEYYELKCEDVDFTSDYCLDNFDLAYSSCWENPHNFKEKYK